MMKHLAVHVPIHPGDGRELREDTVGAAALPSLNHHLIDGLGQAGDRQA